MRLPSIKACKNLVKPKKKSKQPKKIKTIVFHHRRIESDNKHIRRSL